MEWSELSRRRRHMNVPSAVVMALIKALWTKKLPRVSLSCEIPQSARVVMVQKRREAEEYAVNIVCEDWDEVLLGAVSPEIKLVVG